MGTKRKIKTDKVITPGGGNKWTLASASSNDEVLVFLKDGFEPFAVDQGKIYLKKRGN